MKLDYNKIISQKMDDYDEDEYKKLKEDKRREDRRKYGRPEWVYYLWYLHLKLCLEMEEKKIPLRLRRKYMRGFDSIRDVTHIFRLKINRTLYKGIDWDELKSLTWNQWRKRYLNVLMDGDIKKIEHGDEWKCEPQYLYLEVDMRNTETLLVDKLRNILREEKKKKLPSKLGIQGSPKYHPLILGYNMVVGMIEGMGWRNIVDENIMRIERQMNEESGRYLVKELLGPIIKNPDDMDLLNQFEGYCFTNFHRYVLDTQRVLYNVSQGRFYDKTDIPKEKWKDSWSKKTYLW